MSETTERSAYDKLSPQRKQLADMLVANLDSGGLWKQGWRTRGAPENAVTGKKYRGVNNLYLFLVAMERGCTVGYRTENEIGYISVPL